MRGGGFNKRGGGFNKAKGVEILAWVSFGFAVVGGAALVATPLSGLITGLVRILDAGVAMLPAVHIPRGVVPVVLFVGGLIGMGIDLFVDGEPNKVALVVAALLPSIARSVPGQLSASVTSAAQQVMAQVNSGLGAWLGVSSAMAVAIVAIVVAWLMARRVVTKTR